MCIRDRLGGIRPQDATDGTTLVAILRRDLMSSPVSTSSALTPAQQLTVLSQAATVFGIGNHGVLRMTPGVATTALTAFKAIEPVLLPLNPLNGYVSPLDPNAASSGCNAPSNPMLITADCASAPRTVLNYTCGLQGTTPSSIANQKICNWECCPNTLF